MLQMAQDLFGPRDPSFTILGIEFIADNPQIWYPGNRNDIIIQLDSYAATDMSKACYQLAHETVHLLAPDRGNPSTNFEEGVACYFAALYMKLHFSQPSWRPVLPSYMHALQLISSRLDEDIHCVRRLRDQQPSFSHIHQDDMLTEFPALNSADADFLISIFNRDAA